MKLKIEKKYFQIGLTIFLTALAIILVFFGIYRINNIKGYIANINRILSPVIYGFVFAYLMTPLLNLYEHKIVEPLFAKFNLMEKAEEKARHNRIRTISILLTMFSVIWLVYMFFKSVVPELYNSIYNIISSYSVYSNNLMTWLNKLMQDNPDLSRFISQLVQSYTEETENFFSDVALPTVQRLLLPNVNNWLANISASIVKFVKLLWNLVIGLIISVYVMSGKEKFARGGIRLSYACFERNTANKFIESVRYTHHTFIGFFGGKVIDSLIIGVLCYFGCLILKIPFTVLVSVIVGVTNIIPFFGPYIGAIPSIIIILMVDPIKALYFLIFILILQQVDGNFIGPRILSESTGLSSFWIIFAITLFGGLFSVVGMVIGVPVTAVIFAGINSVTDGWLIKKDLPTDPKSYSKVGSITDEGEFIPYEYVPRKKKPKKNNIFYRAGKTVWEFLKRICGKIRDFFLNLFKKTGKKK
ncbi:MAG: AI-2E family transporter [Lachnospiraceae bacterium]|nr:AI-2E family transporter [Lachnospiraceae bacterium]